MSTDVWSIWLASAVVGVAFHQGYARHQEVDFSSWRIISIFSLLNFALWYYFTNALRHTPLQAVHQILLAGVIFITATFCSMLLYRGLFHRLRHIPGPVLARLSSLYLLAKVFIGLQTHLDLEHLHNKYGDVVRIGLLFTMTLDPSD